ncbi:FabD/lysophospholipase-like protein [Myriangium duriaei CBS 260.36]|uniref:FabD/lysophospholipase-like protein n=1 Tax=Myriangium duriaei CBS 260.36 TaxID=1168546 RepID=A0A9P4IXW1_9PEZI|nr:FabD/lysophospholipase-like protein [Myriangium duriaei CBS 260.36]
MPGRGINLLCIDGGIDGGWVQGLSALVLIRKLMEFIDSDHPPKPCEYFDMIGGTGMGGVIAIMLGRLGMTVDECSNHYAALQDRIFCSIIGKPFSNHNRHDHMALELGIKTILRSRGLEDDALFKNSDKAACKVFVTVTCAGTTTIDVLASYYRRKGAAELYNTATIWQAARATSADSTVFEPINIGPSKRRFLGGGTGANNPIFILWEEAMGAFSRHGHLEGNLNCIVSLGCGIGCLERFGENAAIRAKTVDRIVKETDETAKRFLNNRPTVLDTGIYHRFSAPNVGNIINSEDMTSVLQMTDHYIDNKETQDRLQLCTSKLLMRGGEYAVLRSR